jgi:hypothetical protein
MPILDRQILFSDAQSITGTSATASTDTIDNGPFYTGNTARDLGVGEDVYLQVTVTGVTGTSPTVSIVIQTDDNEAFSSPTAIATYSGIALPAAGGNVLLVCLPFGNYERFMRLQYTQGGTSPVAVYKAGLVRGVQAQRIYADAITIS